MKANAIKLILMSGLLAASANAGFEQFNGPSGAVNAYENNGGSLGTWLWWSSWGVPDLQAITVDDRTFELAPNISAYAGAVANGTPYEINYWTDSPDGGQTPGDDGNKFLEALTLFEIASITNGESGAVFSFDVDAFDLDSRYYLEGFVQVLDPSQDYAAIIKDFVAITNTGTHELSITIDPQVNYGMVLQAGWMMRGLNANPAATNWGSATVKATALAADVGDTSPPNPDPMTFAVAPQAISDQAISMTATDATDDAPVEYYFTCTYGDGNDSGWQSSTLYVDTGLAPNSNYAYTVTARDLSTATNMTAASVAASATTHVLDGTAPAPDPMAFAATPVASPISISMTATNASDTSGVEYYFACTSGDGHDSGWQSSAVYYDTGLVPGSNYAYTVTARDLSAATNMTVASAAAMVTTATPDKWMLNPLQGYTGNSTMDATTFGLALDGLEYGSLNPAAAIGFGPAGATFGQGTGYEGRDILRTIGQDYAAASFEAYATYVFDGTWDQSAFIGMGQGVVTGEPGNWGVPELNLSGINGVVGEFKTTLSAGNPNCNMLKIIGGSSITNMLTGPIGTNDTFRVKLSYDADTEMATISVDTNYTGGDFVADFTMATFDTTVSPGNSMWDSAPVRVYAGGGEGTVVSDLMIRAFPSDVVVDDLAAAGLASGNMGLTWGGCVGQTFEVEYTPDLVNVAWSPDPTISDIFDVYGGELSATSTVGGAQGFYRVVPK